MSTTPRNALTTIPPGPARKSPPKSPLAVLHSSKSDDWWTPPHIIKATTKVLGAIDLDPCSNLGTPNVPAAKHYTIYDDGLSKPWSGRVYLNPPYGRVLGKWTGRLIDEFEAGTVTAAVVCVPSRTDTAWFRRFAAYHRCFVTGRLRFSGAVDSAPFPSVCFYLGPDPARFVAVFSAIGDCYGPTLSPTFTSMDDDEDESEAA